MAQRATSNDRFAVPFKRGERVRLERKPGAPNPADIQEVRRWVRSQAGPTAIDVFSGAGGLSLGLENAGFKVLVGADSDPIAVETHVGNLGGLGWVGDLSDPDSFLDDLAAWGITSTDLVAGGVPCQPFSRAGQPRLRELVASGVRESVDPRADLWRSFLRIVNSLGPRAVMVENVPDLPRWNDGVVLAGLLNGLRELGYSVDAQVLAAPDYGVPQHRARLIIVGFREAGRFEWPAKSSNKFTLRDAIGDLPPAPGGHHVQRVPYSADRCSSPFQRLMREGLRGEDRWFVEDHLTRQVRADDLEAYETLREGQTYADLPARLQRYRTDIFTDKYKRLSWDEPSRSITAHIAKDGYWYIHPSQHRTLSIREAARVQSFPDDFRFAGQPTHRFKQIGNAVPPLLGEAVGRAVASALRGTVVPDAIPHGESVRDSLLAWAASSPRHPWRRSGADPWVVLVGELLLGRYGVGPAAEAFPQVISVAASPEAVVDPRSRCVERLQALGIGRAAEALHAIAMELIDLFDGKLPRDHLLLQLLPGVGDNLAQSILCYGFGARTALLDQRTARVVSKVVGRPADSRWQLRIDLHRLAGAGGPDETINAALLEIGTTLCRSTNPDCGRCPLAGACAFAGGRKEGVQETLKVAA